jgi:hypothetical protein
MRLLPLIDMNPLRSRDDGRAALRERGRPAAGPGRTLRNGRSATCPQAKYSCGLRVWQRTIVVYVRERAALPAQSASNRVYFVGRFRSGYHVWQVVK